MFGEFSRYKHAVLMQDSTQHLYLDLRATLDYLSAEETVFPVTAGDTLQNIAARVFAGLPNAAMLWWVIADFQPEPIIDPTVELTEGDWLVIPSKGDVQNWIMASTYGEGEGAL